jgi:hypothetical protein
VSEWRELGETTHQALIYGDDYFTFGEIMLRLMPSGLQRLRCQFSPGMGPSIFGQSGPLPEMAQGKFLLKNG